MILLIASINLDVYCCITRTPEFTAAIVQLLTNGSSGNWRPPRNEVGPLLAAADVVHRALLAVPSFFRICLSSKVANTPRHDIIRELSALEGLFGVRDS
jgi:hypothetical protein